MKAKEIQQLIDFIANSGLDEVNIETDEFKISVKKNSSVQAAVQSPTASPAPAPAVPEAEVSTPQVKAAQPSTVEKNIAPEATGNYVEIKSPMIGTFYQSPSPDEPAFVAIGDKIKEGQTICIVEAMKLFNEIEADVSGTVVKILVDNSSPVEYDQPLFLIDPS
jgi:acetyl-CoA carboxylase biotin carboxyl carrier protein